jgi:hypothetical protein
MQLAFHPGSRVDHDVIAWQPPRRSPPLQLDQRVVGGVGAVDGAAPPRSGRTAAAGRSAGLGGRRTPARTPRSRLRRTAGPGRWHRQECRAFVGVVAPVPQRDSWDNVAGPPVAEGRRFKAFGRAGRINSRRAITSFGAAPPPCPGAPARVVRRCRVGRVAGAVAGVMTVGGGDVGNAGRSAPMEALRRQ